MRLTVKSAAGLNRCIRYNGGNLAAVIRTVSEQSNQLDYLNISKTFKNIISNSVPVVLSV